MIRLETETGYLLMTHVDHARLAGEFAARWGNDLFQPPAPRARVLRGIMSHDDGWAARDAHPQITRSGKPSAFSVELVGKYSAFEEIDLADYLAVRERAVRIVAEADPYAALLVSMHTYNLLSARADRSTIQPDLLPLLDEFLAGQSEFQKDLRRRIAGDNTLTEEEKSQVSIEDHFRLLQACDNLSLLSCVDYQKPSDLLHALPQSGGGKSPVQVHALGTRQFRLSPYPLNASPVTFQLPARLLQGKIFQSAGEFEEHFHDAPVVSLPITLSD